MKGFSRILPVCSSCPAFRFQMPVITKKGDIFNNGDLKDALGTEDEVKLARIASFMKYLNTLLEIGKERVSEQRLEKLKSILSFSTVTSVNTQDGTEEKSEFDWKYRYQK